LYIVVLVVFQLGEKLDDLYHSSAREDVHLGWNRWRSISFLSQQQQEGLNELICHKATPGIADMIRHML
jgi:hypothetical protein